MDIKIIVFGFISALLVIVFYSSSVFVFSADNITTDCSYTKDKKTAFCSTSDSDDVWRCDKQKNDTWKCDKLKASSNMPSTLKDALINAKIGETKTDSKNEKLNGKDSSPLFDPTSKFQSKESCEAQGSEFNEAKGLCEGKQ